MTTRTELSSGDLCRRCRKGHIAPVSMDGVYGYEGEQVSFADEYMRCDACGYEFYTPLQSSAHSRAVTNALRKHQGFMTGDEIREVRLSYDLSLPDFERALGVGRNTVGRWERGTVPPSSAANLGLWLAASHRDVFIKWAKERGVEIKRHNTATVAETKTSLSQNRTVLTLSVGGAADRTARADTRTRTSRTATSGTGTVMIAGGDGR